MWNVVPRKLYGLGDDATSASAMYVDVPVRPMASLPTMSKTERLAITGAKECRSPAARILDVQLKGHPLSWTEKKTISWYDVFLDEISAGLVIDLSPGSGAMARACLNQGIQYVGICRNDRHCSWLMNILNKAAVECIARKDSPLYQQDLASCISAHVMELIDDLHKQEAIVVEETDDEEDPADSDK